MRPIDLLVVHCTATPEGREVSLETIRKWHKDRGFSDIGYHYVIHLDGKLSVGRPVEEQGAHVQGFNRTSIGVSYVGGVDADNVAKAEDTRTEAQKAALLKLVKRLVKDHPGIERIAGHNEFAAKACPSFDVRKDPLGNIPGFKEGRRQ